MVDSKHTKKYKHKDEDNWSKKNPGKKFKPFDPEREIQEYSEKQCSSNASPAQTLRKQEK